MDTEKRSQVSLNPEIAADGANMSSKRNKMAAEFDVTPIQVFASLSGEVMPEEKTPLQMCKMKTPLAELSIDKSGYASELSTSDVRGSGSSRSEGSESNYQISADSPGIKLLSSEGKPTSFVLCLPCDKPRNKVYFRIKRPHQVQEPPRKISMEEKEQLLAIEEHDDTEKECIEGEMILAKRKRGRPLGSRNKSKAVYVPNGEQTKVAITDSHSPIRTVKSVTRCPKRLVESVGRAYKGVSLDFRRSGFRSKRGKKVRPTLDIIAASQEVQTPHQTIFESNLASTVSMDGVREQIANDDRSLSTWYSPLAIEYTKSSPVTHAAKEDQMLGTVNDELIKQTTITTNYLCPSTEKENESVDTGTRFVPFLKRSPLWQMVESLPVFKQLPQNPHFNPLFDCKEHCREGLAIGNMVTFAGLVDKISNFQLGEQKTSLESSLEIILELETQGFNIEAVRDRLNSLLLIKNTHENSLSKSKEVEARFSERCEEKGKLDAEISEIDQKIAELREKRQLVLLASQRKEAETVDLVSDMERWKKSMEGARSEFGRVAAEPWGSNIK